VSERYKTGFLSLSSRAISAINRYVYELAGDYINGILNNAKKIKPPPPGRTE